MAPQQMLGMTGKRRTNPSRCAPRLFRSRGLLPIRYMWLKCLVACQGREITMELLNYRKSGEAILESSVNDAGLG